MQSIRGHYFFFRLFTPMYAALHQFFYKKFSCPFLCSDTPVLPLQGRQVRVRPEHQLRAERRPAPGPLLGRDDMGLLRRQGPADAGPAPGPGRPQQRQ